MLREPVNLIVKIAEMITSQAGIVSIPGLQMEKLRQQEIMGFAQCHTIINEFWFQMLPFKDPLYASYTVYLTQT